MQARPGYANSTMVFLNNRILPGHGCGGQAISLETMNGSLSSVLAVAPGLADATQEQLDLEGRVNAGSSMSGRLAVDK